jgi:hypothetical protein
MPSSKLRQTIFLTGIYVALPSALISLILVGWMIGVENATLVTESVDSPDGRYRAQVVREDPGASSGYEYMVRLMPAGLTPLPRSLRVLPFGAVYVALDAHREPDRLTVSWTGREQVTIRCEGCGDATMGKPKWREIELRYEVR